MRSTFAPAGTASSCISIVSVPYSRTYDAEMVLPAQQPSRHSTVTGCNCQSGVALLLSSGYPQDVVETTCGRALVMIYTALCVGCRTELWYLLYRGEHGGEWGG